MMEGMATPADAIRNILTGFIANEIAHAGKENAVVGLSGGVDSSLVAYLAAEALGPEHVLCLLMPYKTSSPESVQDARLVVDELGVRSKEVDVSQMADVYLEAHAVDASQVRKGNVLARMRMIVLFDNSAVENGLVLGTSNKTELLLGYGTIFGDIACGINPIGDLYKTQVRELAAQLGVPERIVVKTPTADLWPDQSDESELGFSYEEVDKLLHLLVDMRCDRKALLDEGFAGDFIDHVQSIVRRTEFKRRLPLIPKISG